MRQRVRTGRLHGGAGLRARLSKHRGEARRAHGGVTDTNFSERSAAERAQHTSLEDYDDFVDRTSKAFAGMTAARTMSSDEVAKVIYEAATDGTERLRYLVGDDSRGFIRAKQTMSDQDYIEFMRSQFWLERLQ